MWRFYKHCEFFLLKLENQAQFTPIYYSSTVLTTWNIADDTSEYVRLQITDKCDKLEAEQMEYDANNNQP